MDVDQVIDLTEVRELRQAHGGAEDWSPSGLLERVALLLNSTLDLREVLHRLAELALGSTDAQRCTVFLLDGRILRPAVSIGLRADEQLWEAFREMGSIRLAEVKAAWEHVSAGEPLAIEDAARTDLVPKRWITRFEVGAAAVVPLLAVDDPCGVMVVDYTDPRTFSEEELRLLGTVGNYAGIAVRNARVYEASERRARLHEALSRSVGSLVSDEGPAAVARSLVDAYCDLLGVPACAIGLFDGRMEHITTVAARGGSAQGGPIPFSAVPARVLDRLTDAWSEELESVTFDDEPWLADMVGGDGLDRHKVLPLGVAGRVRGAVVLALAQDARLDVEERRAAGTLAEIAAAVLDRVALLERLERNVSRLEILHQLSTFLVEDADASGVVERLNALLAGHGIEVASVAFRDGELRDLFAAEALDPAEVGAGREGDWPLRVDGRMSLPLRLEDRVVGALRVEGEELDSPEMSFLESVGRGIAELAGRASLRARLVAAAREHAVATERERIASDLHDTVAQQFVAIGLEARRAADQLPQDSPWSERFMRLADLAQRGKWDIDQTVRALSFVPSQGGLVRGLKDLAESFRLDSGLDIFLDVDGAPAPVASEVEQVLYRVAHEAVSSAWRHARCTSIRIGLRFDDDEIVLRVRDDGVDLGSRSAEDPDGSDLLGIRRLVTRIGGRVRIEDADPRGALVQVTAVHEPDDPARAT